MHSFTGLEHALSLERFGRYLQWAGDDRDRALELYALNTAVSESLYTPLQMLEVALRNRIHEVLADRYGDAWLDAAGVLKGEAMRRQVGEAREGLLRKKRVASPGRVVASLTLGFWTSFFGPDYDPLWQRTLHRIARREDGKGLRRKDFSGPLTEIRDLRNRVAHHEPIIYLPLTARYGDMLQLTRWLSPIAAEWCDVRSTFRAVWPQDLVLQ
jgi:hypothetical protein